VRTSLRANAKDSISGVNDSSPEGGRQASYRRSYERWRVTSDQAFADAVQMSRFAADVLRALGLELSGGNYLAVRRRVTRLGLDTSHWYRGRPPAGRPLESILVRGGYTNRHRLKLRLIRAGLLHNMCALCGLTPHWHGQALALVLDHINGVNDDYQRDNLRLLCPNCHSQTPTFSGRNRRISSARSPDGRKQE
jgi:hypothetical protein